MSKGKPINIRFEPEQDQALSALSDRAKMNISEIIRRSVNLAHRIYVKTGSITHIADLLEYDQFIKPTGSFYERPASHAANQMSVVAEPAKKKAKKRSA